MNRNLILALSVLLLGIGVFVYFYFSAFSSELSQDIIRVLTEGSEKDKRDRIEWMAQNFSADKDFWMRLIYHDEPSVRIAAYKSLSLFRANVPECYFSAYEKGGREVKLALYSSLINIAPYNDLRFVRLAIADTASSETAVKSAAYSYLAFQSVQDWTPEELQAHSEESAVSRWFEWYQSMEERTRREKIEIYTQRLLRRFCSEKPDIRKRAYEPLRKLYGDEVFYLPSIEEGQPELSEALKWWQSGKESYLDAVMNRIRWDEDFYRGL
ncbi:MAG: hypothetical protein U5N86_02155 [Planctomycetota bacterium]|nr:hypothetical protein [Planctomycetota bacterium]